MSELGEWYSRNSTLFDRAAESLRTVLQRFIDDWAGEYRIRFDHPPIVRVKAAERLLAKCDAREITTVAQFLATPYRVSDLIGGRLVVRSLDDLDACTRAVQENLGLNLLAVDDKVANPSRTGYRAIHIDGELSETMKGLAINLPFELQLKTFAQDAWGSYTHQEAYSRTDINSDARFRSIREVQKVLANQLHSVDELQALIERLSAEIAQRIADEPLTDDINYASVLNLVNQIYGEVLSPQDALSLVALANRLGIENVAALRTLITIDEGSEEAETIVERWRSTHSGKRPSRTEFLGSLIESRAAMPPRSLDQEPEGARSDGPPSSQTLSG